MVNVNIKPLNRVKETANKCIRAAKHNSARKIHSKQILKKAAKTSFEEIIDSLASLSTSPNPKNILEVGKRLMNSGTWVSQSYLRYLSSIIDFSLIRNIKEECEIARKILEHVESGTPLDDPTISEEKVFQTIFFELEYSHFNPEHVSFITVPETQPTLVLVSGVFNEIFSTAAFERGAEHLHKTLGLKYFIPRVDGFKSSLHNSELLKEQITNYIKHHPDEKLWFVSFSKGGLDSLRFIADNDDFAKEYIIGLSTIASPILGSDYLNHRILKLINSVHRFSDTKIYKYLDSKRDLLAKEFQKSLSSQHRKRWFEENHEKLPEDLFYTSLALESNWYESHIWMMVTKFLLQSGSQNDGVVDIQNALFPDYFDGINFGVMQGHHLIGTRSSSYSQEALLEAHIVYLSYKGLI